MKETCEHIEKSNRRIVDNLLQGNEMQRSTLDYAVSNNKRNLASEIRMDFEEFQNKIKDLESEK